MRIRPTRAAHVSYVGCEVQAWVCASPSLGVGLLTMHSVHNLQSHGHEF